MKRIAVLIVILLPLVSASQTLPDINPESLAPWHYYYENQGQLIDENGDSVPDIEYYTEHSSLQLYFEQKKVKFSLMAMDTLDTNVYRLDMSFACGENYEECEPELSSIDMTDNKINYYYEHCPNGILDVPGYEKLEYTDVFQDIDMQFLSNDAGVKAYIIIQPNANPNDVVLFFEGQDSLGIDTTGWLDMYFGGDEISFPQATAYQIDGSNNTYTVSWQPTWVDLGNGYVGLNTGSYVSSDILVIRLAGKPTAITGNNNNLYWSTYYGGEGSEDALDVEFESGESEYFYTLMETYKTDYITSNGKWTAPQKLYDLHITRFKGSRIVEWETFFGSDGNERGVECEYSSSNQQLFVVGNTSGSLTFNQNNGVYDKQSHSGWEGFVLALDQDGQRAWSTYFGGINDDYISCLEVDDQEDILYIGGSTESYQTSVACTSSTSDKFPICNAVSAGYHQTTSASEDAGGRDGFIAAFDISDNSLIYSSFFGGDGNFDDVLDIKTSGAHDSWEDNSSSESYTPIFYICGKSNSTTSETSFPSPRTALTSGSFPLSDPGSGAYFQKENDVASGTQRKNGFIAYFENYNLKWSTFVGGEYEDYLTNLEIISGQEFIGETGLQTHSLYSIGFTNSVTNSSSNCTYNTGDKIPICNSNSNSFIESSAANSNDLYVLRFSYDHSLNWATTYGNDDTFEWESTQNQANNDIEATDFGNIFISLTSIRPSPTSTALSLIQPAYNAYYQPSFAPSHDPNYANCDGMILMFNAENELKWSTYFGGSSSDFLYGMEYKNNKLLVSGMSKSPSIGIPGLESFPLEEPSGGVQFQSVGSGPPFYARRSGTISEFSMPESFLLDISDNSRIMDNIDLFVYPNPATNTINLSLISSRDKKVSTEVFDVNGKKYFSSEHSILKGTNNIELSTSMLSSGIYIMRVLTFESDEIQSIKFTIID